MTTFFTSSGKHDSLFTGRKGQAALWSPVSTSSTALDIAPVFKETDVHAMIDETLLSQLDKDLGIILACELRAGNKVAEVWSGWPYRESIFVILEKPFHKEYGCLPPGIEFRNITDPGFWKAEYYDKKSHHCLGCHF